MARKRNASDLFGVVDFGRIPQSVHNLSCDRYLTSHAGQVRPVYHRLIYPRDKFTIKPQLIVSTFPTTLEFMGSFDVRVDYFFESFANLYGWYDNNAQLAFSEFVQYPRIGLGVESVYSATSPDPGYPGQSIYAYGVGSIFDQLGYPTIPSPVFPDSFSEESPLPGTQFGGAPRAGEPFFAFWDIYRHYYINPQEETFPIACAQAASTPFSSYRVDRFSIKALDVLMRKIRQYTSVSGSYDTSGYMTAGTRNLLSPTVRTTLFGPVYENPSPNSDSVAAGFMQYFANCYYLFDAGIPLCTYSMDYFRGRLNASNQFSASLPVATEDKPLVINDIRLQNKVQKFADLFGLTSGRIGDWIRSVWRTRTGGLDRPEYLGGYSLTLGFSDITQTAPGTASGSPLGWKVSAGMSAGQGRPIYFKSNSYGVLLAVLSIRPRVVYSQVDWPEDCYKDFGSLYAPPMANLGYQPLRRSTINSGIFSASIVNTTGHDSEYVSAGRQLAWVEAMTDIDTAHGLFANPFNLNQYIPTYVPNATGVYAGGNGDLKTDLIRVSGGNMTTYVSPYAWNRFFASTNMFSHNFRITLRQNIRARRCIPYRTMPSL